MRNLIFVCMCIKLSEKHTDLQIKQARRTLRRSVHASAHAYSEYKLGEWNEWSSGPVVQTLSHVLRFGSCLSIKLTQTR
jgi:hypothetical protein